MVDSFTLPSFPSAAFQFCLFIWQILILFAQRWSKQITNAQRAFLSLVSGISTLTTHIFPPQHNTQAYNWVINLLMAKKKEQNWVLEISIF